MVKTIERLIIPVALITPLLAIPQVWSIFASKSAQDVSVLTWILYELIMIPWLLYGIVRDDKPLIIMSVLSLIIQGLIILGAVVYG